MIAQLRKLFLPAPERFSQEQLELMTKAGRRCATQLAPSKTLLNRSYTTTGRTCG